MAATATGGRLRAFLRSPRGRVVAIGGLALLGVLYLRSRGSAAAGVSADGTLDAGTSIPPGAGLDAGPAALVGGDGSAPVYYGDGADAAPVPTAGEVASSILGSDYWGTFAQSLSDAEAARLDAIGAKAAAAAGATPTPTPTAPAPTGANAPALAKTTGVWWNGTYIASIADLQAYRKSVGAPNASLQSFLYEHPALASAIGVPRPSSPGSPLPVAAPKVSVSSPSVIRLPAMTPKQVQTAPSATSSYVVPASPGVPQQVVTVPVVAPPPINVNVRPASSYIPEAVTHGRGLGGPQA